MSPAIKTEEVVVLVKLSDIPRQALTGANSRPSSLHIQNPVSTEIDEPNILLGFGRRLLNLLRWDASPPSRCIF
jgi:hypothetical protein